MEIFTILKANIRHRKGSFFSIVMLMIIIAMSLTAVLSLKENCLKSIEDSHEIAGTGDALVYILDRRFTEELKRSVENHEMVESVVDDRAVITERAAAGENETDNHWMLMKVNDHIRVFNENLTDYEDEILPPAKGEIYVPQGILTSLGCQVGDKLEIETIGGAYEFMIAGVVLEPMNGSAVIGYKQVFVSDEDFEQILSAVIARETEEKASDAHVLMIYKKEDCTLTDTQFRRQLNLDTGITDNGFGSLTRSMAIHYTSLFTEIICAILFIFIVLLLVIVLIVMGHSISTGIEMDYVNLGVLKAQGFEKGKIRLTFILQYVIAELIGAVAGMLFAIPLLYVLGNVFQPITAVIAENQISFGKSLGLILAVMVISGIYIFAVTYKIGKISPVRAISGGADEIYFDSRMNTPICKRGLSVSLAFRQLISGKRRYVAAIAVVSILVFFMMTIMILGNVMTSKTALESMGMLYTECDIHFDNEISDEKLSEIEEEVEKITAIEKKYYMTSVYFSVNGEEIVSNVYRNPEVIMTTEGRAPLYENEIVITDILAEELDLELGDEVTVGYQGNKEQYIITGVYSNISDAGQNFAMSLEGSEKIGFDYVFYGRYSLSDPEKRFEVEQALKERFGDILEVTAIRATNLLDETYGIAINAMKAVIFSFSVIFALIVVMMMCAKAFAKEKTDIGIYKAMGFASSALRLQFAFRFLLVAVLGSGVGAVLSILFSGKILSTVLRSMGIANFAVEWNAFTLFVPMGVICVCFFLFSYAVSGKIRKIGVRRLVTE